MTTHGVGRSGEGKAPRGEEASKARVGIAIVSYMAQDRPDMAVAARLLS